MKYDVINKPSMGKNLFVRPIVRLAVRRQHGFLLAQERRLERRRHGQLQEEALFGAQAHGHGCRAKGG